MLLNNSKLNNNNNGKYKQNPYDKPRETYQQHNTNS
jgi:hypothetical protein